MDRVGKDGLRQIAIAGANIVSTYLSGLPVTDAEGVFLPGDLGVVRAEEVYVSGRTGDVIIIRGSNIPAVQMEMVLADKVGLRRGAIAMYQSSSATIGIVAEAAPVENDRDMENLKSQLSRACWEVVGLRPSAVTVIAKGSLPRTASGKLRRSQLADGLLREV